MKHIQERGTRGEGEGRIEKEDVTASYILAAVVRLCKVYLCKKNYLDTSYSNMGYGEI